MGNKINVTFNGHTYTATLGENAAVYAPILRAIAQLVDQDGPVLAAIDGRCGSGKTTLGKLIAQVLPCNLLHIDDFYLPQELRAGNWQNTPGGNMDFSSVLHAIVEPAKAGKHIVYRPYVCKKSCFGQEVTLPPRQLTVLEGSYCQHPLLRKHYDLRIFLTCTPQAQERRLCSREGDEHFRAFQNTWIPLEERYIREFQVEQAAHLVVDTSHYF